MQEVVLVATEGWQQLDSINLTSTFHRLAQLADGSPAGAAAVRAEVQACGGVWGWLLDCLVAAARQDPEFGPRCAANALWALHKLDALDCARLEALQAPLARALAATAAGSGPPQTRLSARGLTQMLGVLGADPATLPLLLALKPQLLQAVWVAAPELDGQVRACTILRGKAVRQPPSGVCAHLPSCHCAVPSQGISTAWHALGNISVWCSPSDAELGAWPPELLSRLAAAARAVAPSMTFQGLAEVGGMSRHSCAAQPGKWLDTVGAGRHASRLACAHADRRTVLCCIHYPYAGAVRMYQDAAAAVPRRRPAAGAVQRRHTQVGFTGFHPAS